MGNVCSFVDGCLHKEIGIIYLIPSLLVSSVQTAGFTYMVSLQRDLLCTAAIIKIYSSYVTQAAAAVCNFTMPYSTLNI